MKHRGFEPRTTWLKVKCSTDWANIPFVIISAVHLNRASWIRTSDCSSQSAVPYRLAIALYMTPSVSFRHIHVLAGGYWDSNPGPPEPQSGALTNCAIPTICETLVQWLKSLNVPKGIRTPDPRLRRPLLYPAELRTHVNCFCNPKRVMGIEPTYLAWKASVLPLNYTRIYIKPFRVMPRAGIEPATRGFSVLCSTNWAIWANRML